VPALARNLYGNEAFGRHPKLLRDISICGKVWLDATRKKEAGVNLPRRCCSSQDSIDPLDDHRKTH
jgi:hypothetical protein